MTRVRSSGSSLTSAIRPCPSVNSAVSKTAMTTSEKASVTKPGATMTPATPSNTKAAYADNRRCAANRLATAPPNTEPTAPPLVHRAISQPIWSKLRPIWARKLGATAPSKAPKTPHTTAQYRMIHATKGKRRSRAHGVREGVTPSPHAPPGAAAAIVWRRRGRRLHPAQKETVP